jgi:hypothetical protein
VAPDILPRIINADKLIQRLGRWPDFHDAEVLRVVLERDLNGSPAASFLIHVWNMLSEIDERGYYRLDKHTLVELRATRLLECKLDDFNRQNVILDLEVTGELAQDQPVLRMIMSTSYGLSADVLAGSLEVVSVLPCDASGYANGGQ